MQLNLGWVYLVRAADGTGPIKIGHSIRPSTRLKLMQWGNPVDLEFVDIRYGHYTIERSLHRRLKRYRVRGEWYNLPDDVITDTLTWLHRVAPRAWSRESEALTAR